MNKNIEKPYTNNAAKFNANTKENKPEKTSVDVTEPKPAMIGVATNCKKLNVREEPNKNAAVVEVVNAGTEFKIEDEVNGFYKVNNGYVMKDYISLK